MNDKKTDNQGADSQSAADQGIRFEINTQYISDLSFENPYPLEHFSDEKLSPETHLDIDVQNRAVRGSELFEVLLTLKVRVTTPEKPVYLLELVYAGVFTLVNIPDDMRPLVLGIECPRMLFPFARALISSITQESGFPPLILQPIDFSHLFNQSNQGQELAKGA